MENTDLLSLIEKSSDEIDSYLGSVSPKQFVRDVKVLVSKNITKTIIEEAIKKLQTLL